MIIRVNDLGREGHSICLVKDAKIPFDYLLRVLNKPAILAKLKRELQNCTKPMSTSPLRVFQDITDQFCMDNLLEGNRVTLRTNVPQLFKTIALLNRAILTEQIKPRDQAAPGELAYHRFPSEHTLASYDLFSGKIGVKHDSRPSSRSAFLNPYILYFEIEDKNKASIEVELGHSIIGFNIEKPNEAVIWSDLLPEPPGHGRIVKIQQ